MLVIVTISENVVPADKKVMHFVPIHSLFFRHYVTRCNLNVPRTVHDGEGTEFTSVIPADFGEVVVVSTA